MIDSRIFDLDDTVRAYRLGDKNIHWTDYTHDWYNKLSEKEQMEEKNLDNAWDMDSYYSDFDNWWNSLSEETQNNIYHLMYSNE